MALASLQGAEAEPAPAATVAETTTEEFPADEIQYESAPPEKAKAAREQVSDELAEARRLERQADIQPGPNGMMPASAGDNGTYDAPPERRHRITTASMAGEDGWTLENSAILIGRKAIAPPAAPEQVQLAIDAANAIVGYPYVWGGGHGSWSDTGYDCSGAVSYALGGAGLLSAPVNSSTLMDWGEPGPGKWITVYANAGHTYVVIAGLRFDTVGQQRGTGPKWHAEEPYPQGYTLRHPAGL
ncbi:MAG: hypothetical protein U0R24_01155 [Solirubrobacterales bacterium]